MKLVKKFQPLPRCNGNYEELLEENKKIKSGGLRGNNVNKIISKLNAMNELGK